MSLDKFRARVFDDLLPTFCNDPARNYETSWFTGDFAGLHESDASDFLLAMDAGLIQLVGRLYRAPRSYAGEQFFWDSGPRGMKKRISLWLEPIITVGILARLHFELGWPRECIGSQSIDWAFDAAAYLSADEPNEHIACEVKKSSRELCDLVSLMARYGLSSEASARKGVEMNALKKVQALRTRRPGVFWAVGPGRHEFVFDVRYEGEVVLFEESAPAKLSYAAR